MAELRIRKVGAELVVHVLCKTSEDSNIIDKFGRDGEKFTGKIQKAGTYHTPHLELRKKIL